MTRYSKVRCDHCGRVRDCMLHKRAESTPAAARRWLRKTCQEKGKPCSFLYRAGLVFEPSFLAPPRTGGTIER